MTNKMYLAIILSFHKIFQNRPNAVVIGDTHKEPHHAQADDAFQLLLGIGRPNLGLPHEIGDDGGGDDKEKKRDPVLELHSIPPKP